LFISLHIVSFEIKRQSGFILNLSIGRLYLFLSFYVTTLLYDVIASFEFFLDFHYLFKNGFCDGLYDYGICDKKTKFQSLGYLRPRVIFLWNCMASLTIRLHFNPLFLFSFYEPANLLWIFLSMSFFGLKFFILYTFSPSK